MWSVCSRRRLASHARRMWKADSRRSFGAESHRLVDLRRQDDLVAAPGALQPTADDLLRDAVALRHVGRLRPAIDVGGVEEVDAGLDRGVHDGDAGFLVRSESEPHRPEADAADS